MGAGADTDESQLEHRVRLVIVDSPDAAAPLVGALDVADVGAWMWVEAERSLYFSPRVLDLLGLALEPRADLLTRFLRAVHPQDRASVHELITGRRPVGTFTVRYRFTPPNGPLRWIEDHGRVERDANGDLIRQGGALRDVTHDVGRDAEHREAAARLEALVNALPFGVWGRSGPTLTVTHQNAASIAMWGDLRGHALHDSPADVRALWETQIADVMTGQVVRTRREHEAAGECRTIDEIIAPVVVGDEISGVVGVTIDVTEEARAARFQTLLTELSADFASRASETLDAGLTLALEKVARFLGAPAAVLCALGEGRDPHQLRLTHWWLNPASGQDAPRFLELDTRDLRSLLRQVELNSPVVVRTRDELPENSTERAYLVEKQLQSFAIVPMRQLDGTRTLLALAGLQDRIVEWPADTVPCLRLVATLLGGVLARARADANQKVVERRIQDAQKLESLGVLAGGIAHDFNNLLTAILGNASLLRVDLNDSEDAAESIEQIEAASRRAAELCRQMLAYAGRSRLAPQLLDLNRIVREMQALLEITVPRKARLTLKLATPLPAILADEMQVRQLVMNLVLNAIESLADGEGVITLSTAAQNCTSEELAQTAFGPDLAGGTYVSLQIADTGVGIPPEAISRVFDPFFSTKFTGRGLGLAAAVGIVRAHHGAVRVDSAPGSGSTFEVLLPADARTVPLQRDAAGDNDYALLHWKTTGTALVIDDEAGIRELACAVLERAGMTVVAAEDGDSGIDAFRRLADDVRLVVVDLTMPRLDGRETLSAIRRMRPGIAAILMSGYSPTDLLTSSEQVFLQKPFTPAALLAAVKRAL